MTESEWLVSDSPNEMLRHLDGKIDDQAFMRFNVACCRRIWSLITDPRSRAVVEATEAFLAGAIDSEAASLICAEWDRANANDEIEDRAGGFTTEAIESVGGVGYGHAAQVSCACFEAAGYAASKPRSAAGMTQPEVSATWKAAEWTEREAQCQLLRQLFDYRSIQRGEKT